MSNTATSTTMKSKVFIAYTSGDKDTVWHILNELWDKNLDLSIDWFEVNPKWQVRSSHYGKFGVFSYHLEPHAFVLLALSESANALWSDVALTPALQEMNTRDITVMPILLKKCNIPTTLNDYQVFDMSRDLDAAINTLADAISTIPAVDFNKLSPLSFELLAKELLVNLGYSLDQNKISDHDFTAILDDPKHTKTRQTYLVETKLYRDSRTTVNTLNQLLSYANNAPHIDHVILITNGKLTSVAREWLEENLRMSPKQIRVIDGSELKRLLILNSKLVRKYFF